MKPIFLGFTGTQDGMSAKQHHLCQAFMRGLFSQANGLEQFHHGDCVGADEQAHEIVERMNLIQVHIHPPIKLDKRAFCKGLNVLTYKPKDYLVRNHDIVDACPILLATPKGVEILRSGTWATVRYARNKQRSIVIIWPDGTLTEENK